MSKDDDLNMSKDASFEHVSIIQLARPQCAPNHYLSAAARQNAFENSHQIFSIHPNASFEETNRSVSSAPSDEAIFYRSLSLADTMDMDTSRSLFDGLDEEAMVDPEEPANLSKCLERRLQRNTAGAPSNQTLEIPDKSFSPIVSMSSSFQADQHHFSPSKLQEQQPTLETTRMDRDRDMPPMAIYAKIYHSQQTPTHSAHTSTSYESPMYMKELFADPKQDQTQPPETKRISRWMWFLLVIVALCLVLAIGMALGFVLSGRQQAKGSDSSIEASETMDPDIAAMVPSYLPQLSPTEITVTSKWEDKLLKLLRPFSFDEGESMMENGSPQNRALSWMVTVMSSNPNADEISDVSLIQRYALATIHLSTSGPNGDSWLNDENWMSEQDECSWWARDDDSSINVCSDGEITRLRLAGNELQGPLPAEVGMLTSLVHLDLSFNAMTGTLPSEIGYLTDLERILLQSNQFTGSIPASWVGLTQLQLLRVDDNDISGLLLRPTVCEALFTDNSAVLYADCGDSSPETTCPCCTYCCTDQPQEDGTSEFVSGDDYSMNNEDSANGGLYARGVCRCVYEGTSSEAEMC
jgi:hypothetical protein